MYRAQAMHPYKFIRFLKEDIWRIRQKDLTKARSFFIRILRIIILTFRGITEDRIQLRASSLTFYTLLSIVPLLAMVFGIAKGFSLDITLEKLIIQKMSSQQEIVNRAIGFSRELIESVKGGVIATFGIVFLFWSIIKILSNIEDAFNQIWGVKKGRSPMRKISDYLSLMLICPFLLGVSSTITVVVTSKLKLFITKISFLDALNPAISLFVKLIPYGILWALFSFLYLFMPNTKVNAKSGILAGIIAGTIYQIFQWGYINFQIGVTKYHAIYGSFAALPLFLIWLQLSWLVVLLGAEISFAHQNVDTYEFEKDCSRVSYTLRQLLTLRITHLLVKEFSEGDRSWNEIKISQTLNIPVRLVREILHQLVISGIISEINLDMERMSAYQPGRDTEKMTLKNVMDTLEAHGIDNIPVANSKELKEISQSLKSFDDMIEKSPENKRLKDI